MSVYRLKPDNDQYHNFALVEDRHSAIFHRSNGTPMLQDWTPVRITAADTDDELAVLADHALLGTIPVVSDYAAQALTDILTANGELLPLVYPRRPYFAYNVTNVVDALDEQRSSVIKFSSGRVMSVDRFAFNEGRLLGHTIFKIPQLAHTHVLVTDGFIKRARQARLSGFVFEPLSS